MVSFSFGWSLQTLASKECWLHCHYLAILNLCHRYFFKWDHLCSYDCSGWKLTFLPIVNMGVMEPSTPTNHYLEHLKPQSLWSSSHPALYFSRRTSHLLFLSRLNLHLATFVLKLLEIEHLVLKIIHRDHPLLLNLVSSPSPHISNN